MTTLQNLSRVLHCQHFSGKTRVMQTLFSVIVFYQDLKALMKNNLAKYPQTSSPFSQQINFQSKLKGRGVIYWLNKHIFIMILFQVSWIRHSDLHILTVGRYTYTADNRYQSIYNPTTDEWILQVNHSFLAIEADLPLLWLNVFLELSSG